MINNQLESLVQEREKINAQLAGEIQLKNNAENQIQLYQHELDTLVKKVNEKEEFIRQMKNQAQE